ncbi:hypothetical protein J6590_046985 [Homalodisca vitripennis]|nr:hypothetical protein J6590_046985 [Homalodisca vitripennis]
MLRLSGSPPIPRTLPVTISVGFVIRTWQLTGQPRPGSAPQRSDPVALYHQYQQLWKQQKLPGEARHNDLRWTIREKLLGQEPQPRLTDSEPSETNKSVNILPSGPFTVDGRVTGPFKRNKDGEFTIEDRHLTGFFKLSGGSDSEGKSDSEKLYLADKIGNKQDRVECLLEDAVDKIKLSCDKGKKRTGEAMDHNGNHLQTCKSNHDSKTCKYCSWIHYMLNHKEQQPGENQFVINDANLGYKRFQANVNTNSTSAQSNNCHCRQGGTIKDKCEPSIFPKLPSNLQCSQEESNLNRFSRSLTPSKKGYWLERFKNHPANQLTLSSKQSYWPQTFSEAPVHSTDVIAPSKGADKECITSDLLSRVRNDLNVGNTKNPTQNSHNCVDNCFETRVPIALKNVHGEVVTEVKMKDKKTDRPFQSPTKPLMSVATHVRLHKM